VLLLHLPSVLRQLEVVVDVPLLFSREANVLHGVIGGVDLLLVAGVTEGEHPDDLSDLGEDNLVHETGCNHTEQAESNLFGVDRAHFVGVEHEHRVIEGVHVLLHQRGLFVEQRTVPIVDVIQRRDPGIVKP